MMLSILIPTLENRKEQFERLTGKIKKQIAQNHLESELEILDFPDNGEHTVGHKRNILIEQAQGEFIVFIDDDDDINIHYVKLICDAIRKYQDIDCIGLKGRVTFAGKSPHQFIHSIQYKEYSSNNGAYYRPPYHLNPMRRSIAQRYKFEDISYSEDIDWAMRICRDEALQKEFMIDEVLYYYHSRRNWVYQLIVDRTEKIRHALGLQLANRIRVKRWFENNIKVKGL